jgi:hypothetical protein
VLGSPRLEVQVRDGKINNVKVLCGAPCGSTWWMADHLKGKASSLLYKTMGVMCMNTDILSP